MGMLAILALIFAYYALSEKKIDLANERRHQSFLLADELRRSSDDLTRMARLYVVTGNPVYKKYSRDILDIRDGKKPRPEEYQNIYWDLILAEGKPPRPDIGRVIALLELMREAGFTPGELDKLAEAKANSDKLAVTEHAAMKLVESVGRDAGANRTRGRMMLFDDSYHQAKASIMKPIAEFYEMMDKRTQDAVRAAENYAAIWRAVFIVFGFGLMFMLWRAYASLNATLGGRINDVYALIDRIGSGDFSPATPDADEVGVLGWLTKTQARLSEAESRRKSIEQELQASNENVRMILDTSLDAVISMDSSGLITGWNAEAERMFGHTAEHALGKSLADLIVPPRYCDAHNRGLAHFMKTGVGPVLGRRIEMTALRGDGSEFPVELSIVVVRRDQDVFFSAFVRDITERKRAQHELQHNAALLNEAQRLGKLGSWELDHASGQLKWTDEVFRIFELDPAHFSPSYENFLNVIHPDDREMVNRAYTRSLEDRQPYDILHRLLFADDRIKWVHEHCSNDFDASGKPLRSVGAVQDITEQKLTEDSLRVAAVTFEMHEAIMITDTDASIIRVNHAFESVTGYGAEEVLGRNPRMFSSGRHDQAFYADMWQQLLKRGSWSGEIWDRHKNGNIYPKWMTVTAVKNETGATAAYVAVFNDITERKRAEEEIRNLAFYDTLTKLPNRRLLQDRFHLALSVSARSNHYGAVLFLDLDRFKTINDIMGHDHGDLLLIEVARRIQICMREVDTVARQGGDEFVILVEEISLDAQDALQKTALIAEKIRATLTVPYQINGHEYHSTPSIGVCLYRGTEESVEGLLKHADLAMYQAKDSGRNTVRFFDPLMQKSVEARAAIEADLRHAVPGKQLHLHYQIQVDNENRPLGAEALLRWVHPKRGMVPPGQFIPIAEESSMVLEIGHWVLDTACKQLAEWAGNELTRGLILAVNVSGQQFRLHDFVDQVAELVRAHRIDPSLLKLELTESVVLSDVADVIKKMYALKAMGIKLSLDDFGTGYSSLSYLKQLPLDQLKIDQSFVRDIATDPNDAVMVQTIIGLAKNFRLKVIAEGVETEAQLEFLKINGCMAYQGYLFSKPVPVGEFEALLGRL